MTDVKCCESATDNVTSASENCHDRLGKVRMVGHGPAKKLYDTVYTTQLASVVTQ